MSVDQATTTQTLPPVTVTASAPIKAFSDGDEGPSFKDVLDIINPLQHIPIINTIYRHLTGDEEGAVADVAGGALWTGPVGLVGSMVDLAVKADSGRSIGDNILHWLGFDDDEDAAKTQAAQTQQAQQAQAAAVAVAPPPAVTIQALAALPARQRGDDKNDRKDARRDDDAVNTNQPISLTPSQPAAPVIAAAPADKDASGPARQGQFMVFGGSNQPAASVTVEAPAAAVQTASADAGAIGHQGEYWVFGATAAPATPARPVQLAQAAAAFTPAPMPLVSANVSNNTALPPIGSPNVNAVANSVPPSGGPAQLSPMPARTFAAPARRTQVTPTSLPMPTTGTGALPGHNSQAVQTNSDNSSWFAQAFNAGLDKYAAAQRLTGRDNMAASAAAGAQSIH